MIRTEIDSMPTELDVIRRKLIQHEIEEAALKKETDKLSQEMCIRDSQGGCVVADGDDANTMDALRGLERPMWTSRRPGSVCSSSPLGT